MITAAIARIDSHWAASYPIAIMDVAIGKALSTARPWHGNNRYRRQNRNW
jgi:hypothetical protein